ncbi:hypothetical protein LCM4573_22100 [Rhizobium sp. LCM 4573]|nr:hypothetical protein LCM4573_22100 [Rhizobium sp. LCM 4573]
MGHFIAIGPFFHQPIAYLRIDIIRRDTLFPRFRAFMGADIRYDFLLLPNYLKHSHDHLFSQAV